MLGRASEIIGRKQSIFKTAVRLGLIKVNDGPVTFYFEILRAASETPHPDAAQEYILATEHDRIVAEKDAEIARLREALTALVKTHDRENFMRSADFHREDCRCLRCAFDRASAALGDDNG